MKNRILCMVVSILFALTASAGAEENDFPVLQGPYLGQKLSGTAQEMFAPGIISVDANFEHSAAVFSPDGTEVFWCTNVGYYTEARKAGNLRLYTMKMVDGIWTAPRLAPFAQDIRVERPTFSPDGNRLYFESFSDPDNLDDMDIFVVERNGETWSDPRPVTSVINSPAIERIHCFTADGSLYFSRNPFTPNEEIFVAEWANGEFSEPKKLGKDYNSADYYETVIMLPAAEDYMLIGQIDTRHSSPELRICYKQEDGSWSERIRTPYHCGGFLALSPDGRYLFMENEGIRWVSTAFVNELRPKHLFTD